MSSDFFKKAIRKLTDKQLDYESAIQSTDNDTLRLLYADSASVISDCIEMVNETAHEYGIFMN